MKRTLWTRVLGTYLVVSLATLAAIGLIATFALRDVERRLSRSDAEALAALAASLIAQNSSQSAPLVLPSEPPSSPDPPDPPNSPDSPAHADRLMERTSIVVLDPDGSVIAGTSQMPPPPVEPDELAQESLPMSGYRRPGSGLPGVVWAIAAIPALAPPTGEAGPPEESASQSAFVYVAREAGPLGARIRTPLIVIVVAEMLFALIVAFLIHRTLRWISEPMYAIQGAARRYAQGELEVHLRTTGPPELQSLGADLNLMAQQLRNRIAAISAQRNQLESILSSMLEGVLVLDRDRRVVSINAAAGRLLRVAPAESKGKTLLESLRNAQLDDLAAQALEGDEPIERSLTLYRDRPMHVQVHATPLRADDDTSPTGSLLVMNDITRLKQLEDLRRDFVANVSHELKTPITSIKGFVETLLDGAYEDHDTAIRFLEIIHHHTNRLNLIIEDLLSLSRLEQDDQSISFELFELAHVLDAVLDVCAPSAQAKGITIEHVIPGEPVAWGNPSLLEQALVNLVDNAIKYSPEGSRVDVELLNPGNHLTMRVRDSGPGIRPQDQPRIFERFYRTDRARSRELGGTGLGLAIVKHIARAHRGEATVESTPGEGSTFVIDVPGRREAAAKLQSDQEGSAFSPNEQSGLR